MPSIKQTFALVKNLAEFTEQQIRIGKWKHLDAGQEISQEQYEQIMEDYRTQGRVAGRAAKSSLTYGVSLASFVYNYTARTTRFGLRGQDVQDQLKLQDQMVNKAFGIVGAGIVGGLPAMALATVGAVIGEVISYSIQNKAYEYRKSIDEQQKAIAQERIGRAIYNSSRR